MTIQSLKAHWQEVRLVFGELVRRFVDDRLARVAAALSFTTVLALVPLTTVMLSILSLSPYFKSWVGDILDFVYGNFVPAFGDVVRRHLTEFAARAGHLKVAGIVVLAVTALMLLSTIEQALNDIWRVVSRRRWWRRLLSYSLALALAPVLIGLSLTLTSKLVGLPVFADRGVVGSVLSLLEAAMPFAFQMLAFVFLYTVVPATRVSRWHALIGGAVAAALFGLALYGFTRFVASFFASYRIIYGAVATLPLFLVWIYVSWVVVLIGALVTAILSERRPERG